MNDRAHRHGRSWRGARAAPAFAGALIALFLTTSRVSAQEAEALDGAMLFKTKTCFACHGVDAKTPILPEYPRIAGQNFEYIIRQIKDIKSGARNNGNTPAMQGVLHLVNEAEIEALAKYIAGLDPSR
jgi:cytochrome c